MPDIVVVGEALAEIMRKQPGVPLDVTEDFSGPFASGAPAIFADQAARLGHSVAFYGSVGDDGFGSFIRARLRADGVDVSGLRTDPRLSTGVAFVTYRGDGSREFLFHLGNAAAGVLPEVDAAAFAGARWLHICGSSLAGSEAMREALYRAAALAGESGCHISFDPNLRPELLPGGAEEFRRLCEPVLRRARVVMPGRDELRVMTGEDKVEDGCRALVERGVELVAVKLGAEGAIFHTDGACHAAAPFPVRAVDPTGAGDCFDAGVIAGLIEGKPIDEIARLANACGAFGTSRMGPMEGACLRADVDAFLRSDGHPA
jgi:sugar/nucleoside kinase (ribokinase family)